MQLPGMSLSLNVSPAALDWLRLLLFLYSLLKAPERGTFRGAGLLWQHEPGGASKAS